MNNRPFLAVALAAALMSAGCATLEPALPAPDSQVTGAWPIPPTAAGLAALPDQPGIPAEAVAAMGWREFFVDPKLQSLIERSLENNRDLRVAVLNVERARALYRVQRADRLPSVTASGTAERTGGDVPTSEQYSAGVGLSFELDLFGRVRSLSESALQRYFAEEENRRAAQLSLMGEVANAYIATGADEEQLAVSEATLESYLTALDLAEKRHSIGVISGLDLAQIRTQVEAARSDVARLAGIVAQDRNAISLLVGEPVEAEALPSSLSEGIAAIRAVPEGLPSSLLLERPDVRAAENLLRAANANIGAARAAFFPSISLTGAAGSASTELSSLFDGGNQIWSFAPQITLPIFQGGKLRANLGVATADRDIALAQYERSIQAAFREAADALALSTTLRQQEQAQRALVEAAITADRLSEARYRAGIDSFLVRLETQRTLYQARQGLIAVRSADQSNRVNLYRAVGGGWRE